MRRFLALLFTIVTFFAVKETIYIFTTTDPEIIHKKAQLSMVGLSITFPLIIFTLWLWRGKRKNQE